MLSQEILEKIIQQFIQNVRRGKYNRILEIGLETCKICRVLVLQFLVTQDKLKDLLSIVKSTGKSLTEYYPSVFVIGNIVRRVLFIIREEIKHELEDSGVQNIDDNEVQLKEMAKFSVKQLTDIRARVISEINLLKVEILESVNEISEEEFDQIENDDIILTLGHSHTVLEYLRSIAKKKKIQFKVIVTEKAPRLTGKHMVEELSKMGIETALIPDSSLYAVMCCVKKVIFGTRAIMANGAIIAESGAHIAAIAAKLYNIPVLVATALYKLTPQHPSDKHLTNKINNPSKVLEFVDKKEVDVVNPEFDYITPELVSQFITNDGVHTPENIHKLLVEYYDVKDYKLS